MIAAAAGGLFLHASAVVVDGGALLFLGHSTAGKSTIARMLGKTHPVLADDSVYVARGPDGNWRGVDGSFRFERDEWLGWLEEVRRRAEGGGAVPLRGCFRIHKAAAARVEPLAPLELARCLMDAAMEIDLQRKFGRPQEGRGTAAGNMSSVRQMRRQWFRWVAEIARVCPGGSLWFSKESGGVELELENRLSSFLEGNAGPA
ncbi:MAG: hypothetical protein EOM72_00180 [Opitutae bacterium]|nr:hypothetical protein [Opitutae bacterium]